MIWSDALRKTMNEWGDTDSEWGQTDCCQFVRRYHQLKTGDDLGEQFDYETKNEAYRIIAGAGGLCELLVSILGEKTDMVPGDIVMLDDYCPGVLTPYCIVFMGEDGLARADRKRARPLCHKRLAH